jgi:ATP-dependent DNA ligase
VLHSRLNDYVAIATAFDLLMLNGEDMRRKPFIERKAASANCFARMKTFNMSFTSRVMAPRCLRRFASLAWKELSQRNWIHRMSGPSKTWIKFKNPNAPAATRALDGAF